MEEFTVNIPLDDSQKSSWFLRFKNPDVTWTRSKELGPDSGRAGKHCISVPGIKELPLTLECRIVGKTEAGH